MVWVRARVRLCVCVCLLHPAVELPQDTTSDILNPVAQTSIGYIV